MVKIPRVVTPKQNAVKRKNKSKDINRINILRTLKEIGSANQNTISIKGRNFGVRGMEWSDMSNLLNNMCEETWISKEVIKIGRQQTTMFTIEQAGRNLLDQLNTLEQFEELLKLDFFHNIKLEF